MYGRLAALLTLINLAASNASSQLERRWQQHELFRFRDAVEHRRPRADFYSGAAACAFNETHNCERMLEGAAVRSKSIAQLGRIHRLLMVTALRNGRYRAALRELRIVQKFDPTESDPLVEALGSVPDLTASGSGGADAAVRMRGEKVPILINGKAAAFFFDTGASFSVISSSEATRLGMHIDSMSASPASTDINGNAVTFRIAVAKRFRIAGVAVRNVVFLVSNDDQEPFASMPAGERGLIGLPVLRALGSVTWTRDGWFEADHRPEALELSKANLSFDDFNLVTEAGFDSLELPFILDTGAAMTELWPKFRHVASDLIARSGVRSTHKVEGMGGSKTFNVTTVPQVNLKLGGQRVALRPATVLDVSQRDISQYYYGSVGIDLLRQADKITLDFRRMRLTLTPPSHGSIKP